MVAFVRGVSLMLLRKKMCSRMITMIIRKKKKKT